jgi:hypothetical protein
MKEIRQLVLPRTSCLNLICLLRPVYGLPYSAVLQKLDKTEASYILNYDSNFALSQLNAQKRAFSLGCVSLLVPVSVSNNSRTADRIFVKLNYGVFH